MRNLKLLTSVSQICEAKSNKDSLSCFEGSSSCDLSQSGSYGGFFILSNCGGLHYYHKYISGDNDEELSCYSDYGNNSIRPKWSINLNEDENDNDNSWFRCTFVEEISSIVCLSHSGKIVKVSCDDDILEISPYNHEELSAMVFQNMENVGEFEFGINAACWSPDYDVLLLHINLENPDNGAILAMNNMLEVMSEVGVENKASKDAFAISSISWRGDGSEVAVSTLDHDNVRRIRTYKREDLSLVAMGRMETGADVKNISDECRSRSCIAWCPNGSIIAAIEMTKRSARIIFFEACGLRHREFKLQGADPRTDIIREIQWNSKSDVLAIVVERANVQNGTNKSTTLSFVQLWHRDNYHWYLKHEFRYTQRVQKAEFSDDNPYELLLAFVQIGTTSFRSLKHELCWDHDISPDDTATAAVIDGESLHLTPLSIAIVPPPMSASTLHFNAPISNVSFLQSSEFPVNLLVYLSNGDLIALGVSGQDISTQSMISKYMPPQQICSHNLKQICLDKEIDLATLRQATAVDYIQDRNALIIVGIATLTNDLPGADRMIEIEMKVLDIEQSSCNILQNIPLAANVLRMTDWSGQTGKLLVELISGELLEYSHLSGVSPATFCEPLLEACPLISIHDESTICQGSSNDNSLKKPVVIGLSRRQRLYFGDHLICSGASSFILNKSHQFLSYVTLGSRSQLRFIALNFLSNWDPYAGSDDHQNIALIEEGYEPRSVERGSRLVAISPSSPTAVLQMPRGNLEGIVPRALALPFVRSLINRSQYWKAFELMRRQRIDLNLIFDHNPTKFLSECEIFLDQIKKVEYLNLFIASLQDYDVSSFKYIVPAFGESGLAKITEQKSDFDFSKKINILCYELRVRMMNFDFNDEACKEEKVSIDSSNYLLPILSTFAKENPAKLEDALNLIRDVANDKKKPLMSEEIQSSIQYLAFLADYDIIYDTALGMYDFDLCKAVARNSQKDPKIYLPQLARFKAMHPLLAKLDVDIQLKRFESGLNHLFDAKDLVDNHFERCLTLIEAHKLHKSGLRLFQYDAVAYRAIMVSLGNSLLDENKPDIALGIFMAAEPKCFVGAKKAARACGDWRTFFSCCEDDPEEDMNLVASYVAEEIASGRGGMFSKREEVIFSARILIDYCNNVDEATNTLTTASMFEEARRISILYSRKDLLAGINEAAESYGISCVNDFDDRAKAFEEANERYHVVLDIQREAKRNEKASEDTGCDNQSLFSVASRLSNASLYSNMSRSSTASASSLSSVISVNTASNFSLIGENDINKHKSKFNKLGKKAKKKKPKKERKRMKRGSAEELQQLVSTLKGQVVDNDYYLTIMEVIKYLAQEGRVALAQDVYNSYEDLRERVAKSQSIRKKKEEDEELKRKSESEEDYSIVIIGCEDDVNSLHCINLPANLGELFSCLPF